MEYIDLVKILEATEIKASEEHENNIPSPINFAKGFAFDPHLCYKICSLCLNCGNKYIVQEWVCLCKDHVPRVHANARLTIRKWPFLEIQKGTS